VRDWHRTQDNEPGTSINAAGQAGGNAGKGRAREDQQQQQAQRRAALAHSIDGTRSEGVEDITF
jgi:hypothetical protein